MDAVFRATVLTERQAEQSADSKCFRLQLAGTFLTFTLVLFSSA